MSILVLEIKLKPDTSILHVYQTHQSLSFGNNIILHLLLTSVHETNKYINGKGKDHFAFCH